MHAFRSFQVALWAVFSLFFLGVAAGCSSPPSSPDAGGDGDSGAGCGAQAQCGGVCTDSQTDNLNCGSCGTACVPGSSCAAGGCQCAALGFTACAAACLDTNADPNNCGACGVACEFSEQCQAGACTCRAEAQSCGEGCVQTISDPDNCGACGTVCPEVQVCSVGACSDSCAVGLMQCGRSCVDTNTDYANCGACGTTCGAGQSCESGSCACQSGQELCGGVCVDVSNSNLNCGSCGTTCAPGASCASGSCSCGSGQTDCSGSCVDVQTSSAHCGTCGNACAAGMTCQAGACVAGEVTSCGASLTACGGACVDTQASAAHCGTCENDCGSLACVSGSCQAAKACANKKPIVTPTIATFEEYDGTLPVDTWGFAWNAPPGDPAAVYSGLFSYGDGVGTHTLSMSTGDGSSYAPRIDNPSAGGAGAWGGAVGLWMGCVDASNYAGLSLAVKGPVPSNVVGVTLSMEQTSPPDELDEAAGGTCTSDCMEATVEIAVTDAWSEVIIPWSAFTPGTANATTIPVTGDNITGLTFSVQLPYVEDPANPGEYIPDTASYDFSFDDVTLISGADNCGASQSLCGTACVDTQTSALHCGGCDSPCAAGQTCSNGSCSCAGEMTACGDECVNTQTNVYHCGDCDERCLGTCTGGECTSGACGATDATPFGCDFAWGAASDETDRSAYLDLITTWVGYEYVQGRSGDCDGCSLVSDLAGTNALPVFYGYFIGYALPDCNVEPDSPNNLCHAGAQHIRDNRAQIISLYADYAQQAYQTNTSKPVLWLLEGDFIQYTYEEQTNALTMAELGTLASDIVCAIKGAAPNALVAINHSSWITNEQANQFWDAMPLGSIDFVWTTGSGTNGGFINAAPEGAGSYNSATATYAWLHNKTTLGIFVDTSFGPSQQADSWSSASASDLNARIADGVIAASVTEPSNDYQSRVNTLSPQLSTVCQ